ncbi:Calmodulin-binding protein 60 G [Hirschfeldia incana]|nr:Calmodulin-binding protein 60 G [Hirschfeldia incana]
MRNILNLHGSSGRNGLKTRRITFKNTVNKVMRDLPNHRLMIWMEPLLRKIVREELDHRFSQRPYLPSSWSQHERLRSETPSSRSHLKLRFINSPPSSIFTRVKIETEDGSPVTIELVDAATNTRVVSGPLSSSRVEIVPLKAHFTEESWTVDVFKRYIEKQRKGKPPLLTGDITVTLENGVGVIAGDVSFSDNSSWTWSGKFRLGARLTRGGALEARSEAFTCKDQRGVSYEKHFPPYPNDEVWRLKRIAKDGVLAKRLAEQGIFTVKDLRRWYAVYPNELYNILGRETNSGRISKRAWETIVSHAMQCVLDETERYIYNANADGSLIFNSVYDVIKVCFSDGTFRNPDEIPTYQLDRLKSKAYENLALLQRFTEHQHPQRSLQCTQSPGFGIACPELQQHDNLQGTSDPSCSLSSPYFTTANSNIQPEMLMSFENSPATTFHVDRNFLQRNSFRLSEHVPVHSETQTLAASGYVENAADDHGNTFPYYNQPDMSSNFSPGAADWEQQAFSNLSVSVFGTEEAGTFNVRFTNTVGSPRARWCKVKAAFRIREVWKQAAARQRGKACLAY